MSILLRIMMSAMLATRSLAFADRLPGDLARDTQSKPEVLLPGLQLKPGNTAADIFGSGGYYSELLANVVAPTGQVLLINNAGFEAWGINILNDRFTDRDPGNIERRLIDGIELGLGDNSIDAQFLVLF